MTKKLSVIKIKYVGRSAVRIMDDLIWNAENGYVQAVSPAKAAELLTYPTPQFALDVEQDVDAAQAAIDQLINPSPAVGQTEEM